LGIIDYILISNDLNFFKKTIWITLFFFLKQNKLMKKQYFFTIIFLFCLNSCLFSQAKTYNFPKAVDTTTKPIEYQQKKIYHFSQQGVYADNLFDGARLNDFQYLENNLFQATFSPENFPINPSAYYAFRIWSDSLQTIRVELNYTQHSHRYPPKISKDGVNWELLDSTMIQFTQDSINAFLTLDISSDTLWIAAQEVQNSTHVRQWCEAKSKHENVLLSSIGKSKLGRNLWFLDIHDGELKDKDVIIILSRQHPPEVTGYLAMQAFIDEILADHALAKGFRKKYRVIVFPLMNPDGVDLGHWRHSAGGIDLNRDWAYYHQPENRQVANFIVKTVKENKSDVILGFDFHSTYKDVYYTNQEIPKHIPHFKEYWLEGIHESLGEDINEKPSLISGPFSKNWIFTQFNALGITYEIGDSTPRDFIKEKGKVSATEMMQLLIFKEN
jgi:hypothetical protein